MAGQSWSSWCIIDVFRTKADGDGGGHGHQDTREPPQAAGGKRLIKKLQHDVWLIISEASGASSACSERKQRHQRSDTIARTPR
ncbi:hypothetical protein [Paenibacillus elgii]|uniref:hypothetical protein n=1 Tax=Paenibacillus elgii TaxID=189691 RepID=UPI0013D15139|nr:hypothetical protein [Paenibacillus elgii]